MHCRECNFRAGWFVLLAVLVTLLFTSCAEECLYKPRSLVFAEFRSLVNGSDQVAALDSFTLRGLGREDSLLYSAGNNIRAIRFPLNGSEGETAFIIDSRKGTDTIWIISVSIPEFHSVECGFILNFELLETIHTVNFIDSIKIVIKEITSFDDTNIRIYH
jgi:hypothetical protein